MSASIGAAAALALAMLQAPRPAEDVTTAAQGECVSASAVQATARARTLARGRWAPEAYARLTRVLADHGATSPTYDPCRRPLAVFDWDNTVIAGDLGDAAFQDAAEKGLIQPHPRLLEPLDDATKALVEQAADAGVAELRYALHAAYEAVCRARGPEVCYPWLTQAFHGHGQDMLAVFARDVLSRALERPWPTSETLTGAAGPITLQRAVRWRPEMRDLVESAIAHGFDVYVVTASPEWLVARVAPEVGVPSDHVVGMRTVTSTRGEEGVLARPPVTYRQGKVGAIRTRIAPGGRRPVLAVGDALTDREMLEDATGLALLVDRGHRALRDFALARGFAVQPVFEGASERAADERPRGEERTRGGAPERRTPRKRAP
jgi:phosphoserine phosphatase